MALDTQWPWTPAVPYHGGQIRRIFDIMSTFPAVFPFFPVTIPFAAFPQCEMQPNNSLEAARNLNCWPIGSVAVLFRSTA